MDCDLKLEEYAEGQIKAVELSSRDANRDKKPLKAATRETGEAVWLPQKPYP